jgi:hypothetical protein
VAADEMNLVLMARRSLTSLGCTYEKSNNISNSEAIKIVHACFEMLFGVPVLVLEALQRER